MTVSNELLSHTLHSIRKPAVDQLFRSTPLLEHFKKLGGVVVGEHGPKVSVPYMVTTHSEPTAFPTGGERANRSIQDVTRPADFYPADLGSPLFISRKEAKENTGPGMMVKLAETRFRAALGGQKRTVNKQVIAGSSAVGLAAGLATLYGHSAVTPNGYLEGRTAQTNTVGGIGKDAGAIGLKNQWSDVSDLFGTNGPDAMTSIETDCKTVGEYGEPNLIIASKAAFKNYKRGLLALERFSGNDELNAGRLNLKFGDATIFPEAEMPTNATADFEASMYFLNTEGIQLYFWTGCEFDLDNWMDVANGEQVGQMTWLYTKLQIIAIQLASCGFLSDGNTYS